MLQILHYTAMTGTKMGKHRDNYKKTALKMMMNGNHPDVESSSAGVPKSDTWH
jgi:hypothetical protein